MIAFGTTIAMIVIYVAISMIGIEGALGLLAVLASLGAGIAFFFLSISDDVHRNQIAAKHHIRHLRSYVDPSEISGECYGDEGMSSFGARGQLAYSF